MVALTRHAIVSGEESVSPGYQWKPIEDLPENPGALSDGELAALRDVWAERAANLVERRALEEFHRRLHREWAIETGIIERVYSLDRGTTALLIERGVDAALIPHSATDRRPEDVAAIIQDHADVLEGLFAFVKSERTLTAGYVKELHAALLRGQETVTVVDRDGRRFETRLEKGVYKTRPNSPTRTNGAIHEYCPPEHVAAEMDRLIAFYADHQKKEVPPEVEAAWLHHAFTQIHPFEDGNGRVARSLASLVLIKAGWFPLTVPRDALGRYIQALERADAGNLRPLIALFVESQRRQFLKVDEIAFAAKPPETVEEAILAVRDRLLHTGKIVPKEWHRAKEVANQLYDIAFQRLKKVTAKLQSEIKSAQLQYQFTAGEGAVGDFTQRIEYASNPKEFGRCCQIALQAEQSAWIVFCFLSLGATYRGAVAVIPLLHVGGAEPAMLADDIFQINYKEDPAHIQKRFEPWLEKALIRGLTLWRNRL